MLVLLEDSIILQIYILFVLSLVIGSFLANLTISVSSGKNAFVGRSKCDSCKAALGLIDLIPLINWFYLWGRCRCCGAYINSQYIIMEWATFLIFIWSLLVLSLDILWAGCLLGWTLLTLSAIDLRSYRLPDFLTLPLIIMGLVFNGLTRPELFGHFVIGAVAGYILFRAVAFLYRQFRGRDGLGRGDAKLLAAAGAWVGWQGLPVVIILAAMSGIIISFAWGLIRGRESIQNLSVIKIPFGPFLSSAIWITWAYGLNL